MTAVTVNYMQKTATYADVVEHLLKCDDDFIPKLSEKVDITDYSKKIIQNSITFEAWQNDELIGLVAAYFNDTETKTGFITNVSILKKNFGTGIATALLAMCQKYAIANNFKKIKLEVFSNNLNAVKLYKKNNFYIAEEKKSYFILEKIF